jgi:arginine N-succinyltransferase
MVIVREVTLEDLDALWELIGQANVGMTSLKIDKEQLSDRIERSQFAFRRTTERAEGAPYVFVMEDLDQRRIVGTSCVFSKTGGFEPFYAYRIVTEKSHCELLNQTNETRALHLVKTHNGPTEIGSLFLLPEYRGLGCGKLLSLSRFAYMAAYPKRFASQTIAEMRGYQDANGVSPFWEAIGAHFFKIDFPRADSLSMIDKQFIEDLMPRYPIYLDLLPPETLAAIGRVHDQTKPALAMLESQGFVRTDQIDIFDGGPVVQCETQSIRAVKAATEYRFAETPKCDGAPVSGTGQLMGKAIVATRQKPFVAIHCNVFLQGEMVTLERGAQEALGLHHNDPVLVIPSQ